MIFISWSRERGNYFAMTFNLWKHLQPLTILAKRFIVDVWQGSEYASDFEYASVLNIPAFWTYQVCEYARVLNMLMVLNMSGFWIYNSFKYVRVTESFEYAWIIPGYVWLCLNVPRSVWIAFVSYLHIVISYLKEP